MIHNRLRIHYLLIVCIAMAPVFNVDALAGGHMASMPATGIECDMHGSSDHGFCDNAHCLLSTGACGAHGGAGHLPAIPGLTKPLSPLVEKRPSGTTRFRSHPASSIYRPPIS